MADPNQLKIEARRAEAAGEYEKASRLYLRALSAMDEGGNLSDPSLLVRVADLKYRQDAEQSARKYYLQAVDEYAEQGLITNAIAVCNKILRVFPDQVDCYRRLADLHLDVGLTAEARQNLLRFVDEAWDAEEPELVLDGMRSFLDRTPDQEVALRLASCLRDLGRRAEALDALRGVWEERKEAGSDVEALKRKAAEIHSEAPAEEWERGGRPAAADGAARRGDGAPAGARRGNGRGDRDGDGADREDRSPATGEAGRRPPRLPRREVEVMASYRERFLRFRRPSASGDAADDERAESSTGAGGPTSPAGAGREAPPRPARGDRPGPPSERGEARGKEPRAQAERSGGEPSPAPGDTETETEREGEQTMEERNETDTAPGAGAGGAGGWGSDRTAAGEVAPAEEEPAPAGRPETPSAGEELGEEAELRRGMELVDELLEVQPENLDLRERKLRYARRLGERDVLTEASLELADALSKRDARRSARALYRRVLELDPGNQAAEAGLARLDVGELEEKRLAGKRAATSGATPEADAPGEKEARRELGDRLWSEFENSIRQMPWLHGATQAFQATDSGAVPPLETFEMLAHYLMARKQYRDAADVLERALEITEAADREVSDVLYALGRAYERLGEAEEAATYFDRLEQVDEDFARIRQTLSDVDRG